jgi:uncharacterized protein with FMN-binding domain
MSKSKAVSIALFCCLAASLLSGCQEIKALQALTVEDVSVASVKDGVYEGYQDNKIVTARVRVTVEDGRIADIRLLQHNHGPKHGADQILGRILEKQSLMVDAVSGATYSSKVVLKAVELALKQGL